MKTFLLSILFVVLGTPSVFAQPPRPIGGWFGPGMQQRVELKGQSLKAWGIPFLASTSPGDAILQGAQGVGSVQQAQQEIFLRAQQLCNYYGYATMLNYTLDPRTPSRFVVIDNSGRIVYAPQALINPFQVGHIVGRARGFSRIACAR